ncbi:MAG: tetratricopeptide repeat protein [Candidatus Latescibacteria bacterium]|nr:tetratricopeptide repeat protein [Candidatus Latescibacterota bacterium]
MSLLRHVAIAAFVVSSLATSVSWAQKSYTYETDPIRVGNKALEKNDLAAAKAAFDEAVTNSYELPKAKVGLAEVATRSGRFEEAENLYREALDIHGREGGKGFPEADAGLGILLVDADRWDEGIQHINKAYKQNSGYWPAIYGQARVEIRNKKWDKAKSYLDWGASRKGVGQGEDLYHRGMALLYLGRNDLLGAEKEALTALHMNPTDPRHGVLVAQVYEKRNVPASAIAACEEVLRTPGVTPTASFIHFLGTLYQKAGRYNDARDRYVQSVDMDSTYAPALKDLGDLFVLAKQYDNASKVYLRYLELEPDDLGAYVGLTQSLGQSGRHAQALQAANKAMGIDSTRADVRLAYARSALRNRDKALRARGAEMYATLPDSVKLGAEDLVLLAGYEIESGQLEEAKVHLDQAVEADSSYAEAHFQRGLLAFKTNQPAEAVAHFEEAIRRDPKVALYHLNLGVAYFQANQIDNAKPALRRAIALDKRPVMGHVLLGQALVASDSLEAAEAEYQKALALDPKNARALRGLGFTYLRTAAFDKAADTYKAATDADPRNADGWAGLGQSYLGLGDLANAEDAFSKAQSIDPSNASLKRGRDLLAKMRKGG